MKLPSDAIIAIEKITNYLLQWRPENDKSQILAQAGYTDQDADRCPRYPSTIAYIGGRI